MRYGDVRGALNKLIAIEPWLCENTEFGGRALIDLGWAYDASGDRETARKVMARLRKNVSKDVRRMSQQLAFQDEAAGFLGVKDTIDPADGPTEFEKLSRLPRVKTDGRDNLLDGALASVRRPPVASLSEARMQLRSAAVRRSDGGAPQRLVQAVNYVQACAAGTNNNTDPTVPEGGVDGCAATLQGTWLLAVTFRGGAGEEKRPFSFAPNEAQQLELSTTAAGTFERLAPGSGPGCTARAAPRRSRHSQARAAAVAAAAVAAVAAVAWRRERRRLHRSRHPARGGGVQAGSAARAQPVAVESRARAAARPHAVRVRVERRRCERVGAPTLGPIRTGVERRSRAAPKHQAQGPRASLHVHATSNALATPRACRSHSRVMQVAVAHLE